MGKTNEQLSEELKDVSRSFIDQTQMVVKMFGDRQKKIDEIYVRKDVLEQRLTNIEKNQEEILTHVKTTNGRVTKLETWRTAIVTGGTLVFAVITFFGAKIRNFFFGR
mgnify:CR=1 FL=1